MTGGNNEVSASSPTISNASQSDYKVVPSYKGGYADTMNAGIAAFRAGNAPAIMQVSKSAPHHDGGDRRG